MSNTVTIMAGSKQGNPLVFEPKEVVISAGDTVRWVANYMMPHNIIVQLHPDLSHTRQMYREGEFCETRFAEPGEYTYWSEKHRGAGMVGKIIVE